MVADKGRETPKFGLIIRQRRIELGLTQEELAERVGESVRQSDISRMERDHVSLPRRERLEALAAALEVTPGYLLMHSGWATDSDARDPGDDTSRGQRQPGTPKVEGTPRPDHSTRILIASQDVLAANRELTRAIEALADESRQSHGVANGRSLATRHRDATYDELEILNRELQAVIDSLNIRTEDLEAQALRLIARAANAESDRFQLSAVLNAVGDVVIAVNEGEAIVLQSQSYSDLVGDDAGKLSFRDIDGKPLTGDDSPLARVARGESFTITLQLVTPDGAARPYEAIGRPSAAIGGHRLGVLTLRASAD